MTGGKDMKRLIMSCTLIYGLLPKRHCTCMPKIRKNLRKRLAAGVCPPFYLKDEGGNIIDPVRNINTDKPYSPKQTCGTKGCHDYNKITEGFHFTQGKGEKVPDLFAKRYNWVSSPGNYGGTWCSPAPLYRQLAPKRNDRRAG
jgi:hypothetical protein